MPKHQLHLFVELCGLMVFVIGFITLLGFIFDIERLARWAGHPGMALNTAAGFFLCGLGLFFSGFLLQHSKGDIIVLKRTARSALHRRKVIDALAVLVVIGCFLLMAFEKSVDAVGILIIVVGYYFGRTTLLPDESCQRHRKGE